MFHVCLFPKPVQSQSQQAISKKRIKSCLFGICEKQSETVKSVEHSKNDYHEPSEQVPKDWLNGKFDAKWQEKELHKWRQKCFKRLVKWQTIYLTGHYCKASKQVQNKDFQQENCAKGIAFGRI